MPLFAKVQLIVVGFSSDKGYVDKFIYNYEQIMKT